MKIQAKSEKGNYSQQWSGDNSIVKGKEVQNVNLMFY